jgi:hypothetical protein
MNTREYLDGQRDCRDGLQAKLNASQDYYDGFACQYEAEQILTEMGLRNER